MDLIDTFVSPIAVEIIGISGFILYVLNYTLLTFRVLDAQQTSYFVLNLLAASLVLIGLSVSFNLAAAMIQFFWIGISIIAIVVRLTGKSTAFRRPLA